MPEEVRVVLVVWNDILRYGLERHLSKQVPLLHIVDSYETIGSARASFDKAAIDLLIWDDERVPQDDLATGVDLLHRFYRELRILVLSERRAPDYLRALIQRGVSACVQKTEQLNEEVVEACKSLMQGRRYFCDQTINLLSLKEDVAKISDRDLRVLQMLASGLEPVTIAHALDTDPSVIYRVRKRLKDKLGVSTNETLMLEALKRGWLKPR